MSRGQKILALLQNIESGKEVDKMENKIEFTVSSMSRTPSPLENAAITVVEEEVYGNIDEGESTTPLDYADLTKRGTLRRTSVSSNSSTSSSTSSFASSSSSSSTASEKNLQPEAKYEKLEICQNRLHSDKNLNESIGRVNHRISN